MSAPDYDSYLGDLLRLGLEVRLVHAKRWKPGQVLPESIVDTHRLILLTRGSLNYCVENRTRRFTAPGMIYVPGWVRRSWKSVGKEAAELCWLEFSSDAPDAEVGAPLFVKGKIPELELALFRGLMKAWRQGKVPQSRPVMEAESKALLALFFAGGPEEKKAARAADRRRSMAPAELELLRFLDHLKKHFAEPGVLQAAQAGVKSNPNYFRQLFQRKTSRSMHDYVTQLRMRRARYLLNETDLRVKEVAARSGYRDALRFSKVYRAFWGHPPSAERSSAKPGP